jgi:hypothetical protein
MKIAKFLFILLFMPNILSADYSPKTIYEMIIKADEIVYGEIVSLDSSNYTLRIDGNLTGDFEFIKIKRFTDWSCASRWTDYKVGQKLLLFLIFHNNRWITMSGGAEGELPIQNDSVYISYGSLVPLPPPPPPGEESNKVYQAQLAAAIDFELDEYQVYDKIFFGRAVEFRTFLATVIKIRDCFTFNYANYNEITDGEMNCDDSILMDESLDLIILQWTYNRLIKK